MAAKKQCCDLFDVVDETTDSHVHHVANFIVGSLSEDKPGKEHLITCKVLHKTYQSSIASYYGWELTVEIYNGIIFIFQ